MKYSHSHHSSITFTNNLPSTQTLLRCQDWISCLLDILHPKGNFWVPHTHYPQTGRLHCPSVPNGTQSQTKNHARDFEWWYSQPPVDRNVGNTVTNFENQSKSTYHQLLFVNKHHCCCFPQESWLQKRTVSGLLWLICFRVEWKGKSKLNFFLQVIFYIFCCWVFDHGDHQAKIVSFLANTLRCNITLKSMTMWCNILTVHPAANLH